MIRIPEKKNELNISIICVRLASWLRLAKLSQCPGSNIAKNREPSASGIRDVILHALCLPALSLDYFMLPSILVVYSVYSEDMDFYPWYKSFCSLNWRWR